MSPETVTPEIPATEAGTIKTLSIEEIVGDPRLPDLPERYFRVEQEYHHPHLAARKRGVLTIVRGLAESVARNLGLEVPEAQPEPRKRGGKR